jgi:hypothetical protein
MNHTTQPTARSAIGAARLSAFGVVAVALRSAGFAPAPI